MDKTSIFALELSELEDFFSVNGMNKAKAKIVCKSLYQSRISDFDDIGKLGTAAKTLLKNNFFIGGLKVIEKLENEEACKYLFGLSDGNTVEAVLMKHDYGNGLCISTQIGCNMHCAFCESGRNGKVRDLTPDEMTAQVLEVMKLSDEVSHIVLMGIGEPFDNYENVMKFVRIACSPYCLDFGTKHITVSTCGIVPRIIQFVGEPVRTNLAVSLHAPNDILRSQIMPVNKKYGISVLMNALREYNEKAGRKFTVEYIMLDEFNDSAECARELALLVSGMNCYVNLIPYNETSSEYKRTPHEKLMIFYDILKKAGINVTIRREFGAELKAACGQLRADNTASQKSRM